MSPLPKFTPVSRWLRPLLLVLALLSLASMAGYWAWQHDQAPMRLVTCLSYGRSTPGPLAKFLGKEAAKRGLEIEFVPAYGSETTRQMLLQGQLDVALLRSSVAREEQEICQIAVGGLEVLHLFVRTESPETFTPADLRGKRVALGHPGDETSGFVGLVLDYMGLSADADFEVAPYTAEECLSLADEELPDAIFDVALLPSPRGERLAREHGYRLVPLPLGEALRLRDPAFQDVVIAPCAYSVSPPVPAVATHTLAARLTLVAHRGASSMAIKRLLQVIFESNFARRAGVEGLDPTRLTESLDCPLHPGAAAYLDRNRPLIRAETVENLQGIQGILGTLSCGFLIAWGWYRRKRSPGVERYPQMLAALELEAIRRSSRQGLSHDDLRELTQRLAALREELLDHIASRRVADDARLSELLQRFALAESTFERIGRRAWSGDTQRAA